MAQLDVERCAMDRTLRLHRAASARLLPTAAAHTAVPRQRNKSASAAQQRARQSLNGTRAVGSPLSLTGHRAELLPRGGDAEDSCSNGSSIGGDAQERPRTVKHGIRRGETEAAATGLRPDSPIVAPSHDQRPPSRQRDAFPIHLAEILLPPPRAAKKKPQPASAAAARKSAGEQARPPSRHKPPEHSLFLDLPFTAPPTASPVATTPLATTAAARTPKSSTVALAATTAVVAAAAKSTLDLRHDDPDRDGFNVLEPEGPCPFRIRITNS
ncbi:unnamed protein product, partial [Phaeothamnion confervicola]